MMNIKCGVLIFLACATILPSGYAAQHGGDHHRLHGFTISPAYFINGITENMTMRCDLGPYIHAITKAMVLQLSKVDGNSVATLVTEQESGGGPVLVATTLQGRASIEGKIDPQDLPGTYIQLTLQHPDVTDSGKYMCSMTIMDHTDFVATFTYNSTATLENATVDALLDHVNGLHGKIEDVTRHLAESKTLNKALQDRVSALEETFRNSTHSSAVLEESVDTLTRDMRQLQHEVDTLHHNMSCPASCKQGIDRMGESLNDTTVMVRNEIMDRINEQEEKNRVVFFAKHPNTAKGLVTLHHSEIIKFEDVVLNEGNGYHNDTGTFVAPVNGTYVFLLNVPIIDKDPSRQFNIAMTVNFDVTIGQIENDQDKIPSSVTVVRHLTAGSKVLLYSFQVAGAQGNEEPTFSKYSSYFGGFLLHAD